MGNQNPLLDAALAYAARGWAVFPCRLDKSPFTWNGFKDASTDPDQIRHWWARWPDAAIGCACGASKLVVIDCDVKNGPDGIRAFEELGVGHEGALHSRTPSGGMHALFSDPTDGAVRNSKKKLAAGVDVRGDGGYVLLPPSAVASGEYVQLDDWHRDPAPLPGALVTLLSKPAPPAAPQSTPRALARTDREVAWAAAALQSELDAVLTASEGTRNDQLNRSAFALGQIVGGGALDPATVETELLSAATASGYVADDGEDTARRTIASGLTAGRLQPRTVPQRTPTSGYNLTDLGNAQRLIARHGGTLRYLYRWGCWLYWDGQRWVRDECGYVPRCAKKTARSIYAEAGAITDDMRRKAVVDHARKTEGRFRLNAMIELAKSEPGVAILPADLDADPWLLNVLNGTLDLRTGELRQHNCEDAITKIAPVEYDPEARLKMWEDFLDTATGGNEELAAFLQRAAGYTLTGDTSEEVLLFIHGPAAAGKSTFVEALKATLGDYALTADFDTFLSRRSSGGPRPDIARLAGARMVASLEVDEGTSLAEGLIKALTGGDTITARELYAKAFEFRPAFKLWLAANHAPHVSAGDEAIWRRIRKVPFDVMIPEAERDPAVKAKLRNPEIAGSAILAWAVQGCLAWQQEGLGTCPAVANSTAALRAEMDPLHDFLEEGVILSPASWTPSASLRDAYEAWCRERGEKSVGGRPYTDSLRAAGCEPVKRGGQRGWQGIGLLPVASSPRTPGH